MFERERVFLKLKITTPFSPMLLPSGFGKAQINRKTYFQYLVDGSLGLSATTVRTYAMLSLAHFSSMTVKVMFTVYSSYRGRKIFFIAISSTREDLDCLKQINRNNK